MDSTSIFVTAVPSQLPLSPVAKSTHRCPKCADDRVKTNTRTLTVYRDPDGYVRWQCFHPTCQWAVRHAAHDPNSDNVVEDEEAAIEAVMPIPFDPTQDELIKQVAANYEFVHWYKNSAGEFLFAIVRTSTKAFYPLTLLKSGDWSLQTAPPGKFLYSVKSLADNPEAPIIVVEGEKAVDLGQPKFPKSILVSWPGGSGGTHRGDWDQLKGRSVLIWPDNDEPGTAAAQKITAYLKGECAIAYTNHLPPKADVADPLTPEEIRQAITKRIDQAYTLEISNALTQSKFFQGLKESAVGTATGWDIVDKSVLLRGLTIIEGRSGHGKSTVMMNLANNMVGRKHKVVFYTYEMPGYEILSRMSMLQEERVLSDVPWENAKKYAEMITSGKAKGYKYYTQYLNKQIFISDEALNIQQLVTQLEQPALSGSVVFIDYIQMIPADKDTSYMPRYLQIKTFSEKLKQVSKKNNLTIVAGAQVTATSDRPTQDVIREGKDIYNAADVVLRAWNNEEGKEVGTTWFGPIGPKTTLPTSDGAIIVRKARAGASNRHFDFNFSPTRKMLFLERESKDLDTIL